ncbi:MAG: hypothetical protein A2Y38_18205 [Spirochaetes bacterium GWB1_59_5]|nr:MAG: hypothetical protein A2Y38_18205 [Spirochaetes bacterium GWB1_59_5]
MFPNDLLVYRAKLGLTQGEVAAETGIPRSRLSLWETGRGLPTLAEAQKLASLYGVAISQMWPDGKFLSLIGSV